MHKGENMQDLSFKQVVKTILPKTKLIVVIIIIAAIIGACIGAASTYAKSYFGTTIEFYVNPMRGDETGTSNSQFGVYGAYGQHVMDNIIKLLSSESFAEEMLLGENGLPIESVLQKESDRTAIDEKIADAKGPIGEAEKAKAELTAADELLSDKKLVYDNAKSLASKMNSNYLSLLSTSNASEEELALAKQQSDDAAAAETQAKYDYDAAEQDVQIKTRDYQAKQKAANVKIDAVLELWRGSDVYKDYIEVLTESIKYSFYREGEVTTIGTGAEALAKSFIYVDIRVTKDSTVAQFVYDRVSEVLPRYVQENMAVPSGYVGTNCVRITRLDGIEQAESGKILAEALKYAIISAILVGLVSVVIIVAGASSKSWYQSFKKELDEEETAKDASEGETPEK